MYLQAPVAPSQAFAKGFPDKKSSTKWRDLHAKTRPALSGVAEACSADVMLLHLPRERDAWSILQNQHPGAKSMVADLSQSITRTGVRVDGRLPCITPGSVLAMVAAGRVVTPLEKVMLHGLPVHRMMFPSDVSSADIERAGGNTMHVHIVGAAILMLLSLVDWGLPNVTTACCDFDFQRPRSKGQGPRSRVLSTKSIAHGGRSKKHQSLTSRCSKVIQKCKGQGSRVKKPMQTGKCAMLQLASRWALPKCQEPVIQSCKAKIRSQKTCALFGTRWG